MNFGHRFIHTIYVAAKTGVSNKGDPTFGTPAPVACRVEGATATLRQGQGLETVCETRIITETAIAKTSRVWLPGVSSSDATLAKVPKKVRPIPTIGGDYTLFEVLLG